MNLRFPHTFYYKPDIDLRIDAVFNRLYNKHDRVDGFRVAELTSQEELAEYEEAKKNGKYGSHDEEYLDKPTGRRFMIGFNLG
jgi:hypothetical protein